MYSFIIIIIVLLSISVLHFMSPNADVKVCSTFLQSSACAQVAITFTGSLWFVVASPVSYAQQLQLLNTLCRTCTVKVFTLLLVIWYTSCFHLFSFSQLTLPIKWSITKLEQIQFGYLVIQFSFPIFRLYSFSQSLYYKIVTFLFLFTFK